MHRVPGTLVQEAGHGRDPDVGDQLPLGWTLGSPSHPSTVEGRSLFLQHLTQPPGSATHNPFAPWVGWPSSLPTLDSTL